MRSKNINSLRRKCDKGYADRIDWEAVSDPHVVAGLLLLFLKLMPVALITPALYDQLLVKFNYLTPGLL